MYFSEEDRDIIDNNIWLHGYNALTLLFDTQLLQQEHLTPPVIVTSKAITHHTEYVNQQAMTSIAISH